MNRAEWTRGERNAERRIEADAMSSFNSGANCVFSSETMGQAAGHTMLAHQHVEPGRLAKAIEQIHKFVSLQFRSPIIASKQRITL